MGRITVFSLASCPHCKRAKALLDSRGMPWEDVSLTDYPEKRGDMLKVSDRLTVPQIFFGSEHLGGADDVVALDQEGRLGELYERLVVGQEDPPDRRLYRPEYPPKRFPEPAARREDIFQLGGRSVTYVEAVAALQRGLPIGSRMYRLMTYPRCFTGRDLVDFLVREFGLGSRMEGVSVGQELLQRGVLHHVHHEHGVKDTAALFFRLQADSRPLELNALRVWDDRVDDPSVTLRSCKALYKAAEGRHQDAEGLVDYVALARDEGFTAFREAVCELQRVKPGAMSREERLAFFINLYNMAVLHAFAQVGIPSSSLERYSFFDSVCYNVGGQLLSLNEIENGILRANQVPPYHRGVPFPPGDPRCAWALDVGEPRIHFALNCGARSCPPVKDFTAENIDSELDLATTAFFEGDCECLVDLKSRKITVNQFMKWYGKDFGGSGREVAGFVARFARGAKRAQLEELLAGPGEVMVSYFDYDWTTNSSRAKSWGDHSKGVPRGEPKNGGGEGGMPPPREPSGCCVM